jgi:GNAT superfamily N-acetyltransferase
MQLIVIPSLTRRGAQRLEIEGVRVAAAHRGAGLGRRMISWAVSEARASGCALVQLTTDKRREDARRFYESLGFAATHEGMKLTL